MTFPVLSISQGAYQNKLETAKTLTEMGFAVEAIVKASGLSLEEINTLLLSFLIKNNIIMSTVKTVSVVISYPKTLSGTDFIYCHCGNKPIFRYFFISS